MAKTIFSNGTIVTSDFLNLLFGNNADVGHVHDQTNYDGHAPKIHLYNHVDLTVNSLTGTISTSYLTEQQTGVVTWVMAGRIVLLYISNIFGTSNNSAYLRMTLSGTPSLPASYESPQFANCQLYDGGMQVPGQVRISSTTLDFYCLPAPVVGVKAAFGNNFDLSSTKGIPGQAICFFIA